MPFKFIDNCFFILKTHLHTTNNLCSMTFKKQSKILNKMMQPTKKRKWYDSHNTLPAAKGLSKTDHEPNKRALKRKAVLNKMFMRHITDMLSTGSIAMEVLGRGLEISKVNISPDFQIVNVYWVSKCQQDEFEIESVLNRTAGILRHELSQLRVMGEVPTIEFVKDKEQAELIEMNRRLLIADYGDEYTPTQLGQQLKSDFTLETPLSDELKQKIRQVESTIDEEIDEDLPKMSNTVYGLDHAQMMRRMLATRTKRLEAWGNISNSENIKSYRSPIIQTDNDTKTLSDRKSLKDFLKKRLIQEEKLHSELKKNQAAIQIIDKNESLAQNYDEYYTDSEFDSCDEQEFENE